MDTTGLYSTIKNSEKTEKSLDQENKSPINPGGEK